MSLVDSTDNSSAATVASRYRRLVAALRYADFRVLWLSTVSNQLGLGMQQVLLGWLVYDMTGSGGLVGAIFAVRSAPNLVVGFAAGSITDWLDRRTLIRVSVLGMMLAALTTALLLFTGLLTVWHLMLTTFLLGAMQAFYMTARQVYVYDIVGATGAVNGIALISLAQRVGGIIGSLLAGGLIQWSGPGTAFLVMAASYCLGVIVLRYLRHRGEAAPESREPILQNIISYFRALKSNRVMMSLIISTAAAEVLGFSHQVMLPILAEEVLQVGAAWLGVLTAFRFFGGALGVMALTALGEMRRQGILLLVILGLFGLGLILLSQSDVLWMALLFVTFINVMASVTDVLHHTLLQKSVSNEQRGRAMGSWIVGTGAAPLGHLEIGYLAALTTAQVALLTNGIGLAVLAVILAVVLPRLRGL